MRRVAAFAVLLATLSVAPAHASYNYALQRHPTSTRSVAAQLCFDRGLTLFYAYNRLALAAAYSNEGSWTDAKRVARQLTAEGALVPAMFVYLRCGRWDEILQMPTPKVDANEPIRIPVWHFARGMAFANQKRLPDAQAIEPPDWYFAARESLGGELYADGACVEAAQVFRDDLQRNPRNPRAFFGLYQCLKAEGRNSEAAWVLQQFGAAWNHADTHLEISKL